jgi:hypothetical protein
MKNLKETVTKNSPLSRRRRVLRDISIPPTDKFN